MVSSTFEMPEQVIHLICAECGTFSEGEAEGWRAYTAGGLTTRKTPIRSWSPSARNAPSASLTSPIREGT